MYKAVLFMFIFLVGGTTWGNLHAQVRKTEEMASSPTLQLSVGDDARFLPHQNILPQFARENPTGYSYLCRLELSAENQMALPVWVKIQGEGRQPDLGQQVRLQFKVLRF